MLTVSILENRERGEEKKKHIENIFEPFYSTGHKLISNSMKKSSLIRRSGFWFLRDTGNFHLGVLQMTL